MTLFMESTKISPETTVTQIQRLLGSYKATAILTEYENSEVSGVFFRLQAGGIEISYRLPCRWRAIYQLLQKQRKTKASKYEKDDQDKAKRVAWRQILHWLEAQLALIDTEMVKPEEVFMPYMQISPKQTLFEKLEQVGWKFKQLNAGNEESEGR